MLHNRAFTILELAVVVILLGVLVVLFLPALGSNRCTSRMPTANAYNLRGIQQAMVYYSQGNNQWFPGLDSSGKVVEPSTARRLLLLLQGGYIQSESIIIPLERGTPWKGEATLQPDQYSYALIQIDDADADSGRISECTSNANTQAPIASDRNTSTTGGLESLHVPPGSGAGWRGGVVWNDNHVSFETSHILARTKLGGVANSNDHLFAAAGPNDAVMTFYKGEWNMTSRGQPSPPPAPVWPIYTLVGLVILTLGLGGGIMLTMLYQRRDQKKIHVNTGCTCLVTPAAAP